MKRKQLKKPRRTFSTFLTLLRGGGIIIGCTASSDSAKMRVIAEQNLSDNYDIVALKAALPKARITGMSEKLDENAFLHYLKAQNADIISNSSEIKLLSITPTKKNDSIYQAVQLDLVTFQRFMNFGHLLIGLESCSIFDAIDVTRCYKCNEFNHSFKQCKSLSSVCPLCSGMHNLKKCKSLPGDLNARTASTIPRNTKSLVI